MDDVEFGSALHILEQRLQRVYIRDVAFKHLGPSGQMLRGLLAGQHEGADAPAITHKLPDNGAAHAFGGLRGDGEAEAAALIEILPGRVAAVKDVEQLAKRLIGYARAVVVHAEQQAAVHYSAGYRRPAHGLGSVLGAVVQQVH